MNEMPFVSRVPGRLITRRHFLRATGAGSAAVLVAPVCVPSSVFGAEGAVPPSKRITVGLVGHGCMGSGHLRRIAYDRKFQLLAVADADRTRREAGKAAAEEIYAAAEPGGTYRGCQAYADYREVLARPDIDAVVIVTPDHWHALQSIDAAKAGKDIYCEKPVSMTIHESRRMVQAVHRYSRVFQTGTQYRSIPAIRTVCEFVRNGGLGKIKSVFTQLHTLRPWIAGERFKPYAHVVNPEQCGDSIVPLDFALPAEPVPEGLDWDLWVGPAPWRPYNRLYHINPWPGVVPWSFADAFGVTSSTWFLSHAVDVLQYALGTERSGPVEIFHPADSNYPTMTCRYENGTLMHFIEQWPQVKKLYGAVPDAARLEGMFGGVIVGERGWVTTMSNGGKIEGEPEAIFAEMGLKREVNIGSNDHHANWLACIRNRKPPSADEEIGHRSASLGHLLYISCWTRKSLKWDPRSERFLGNDFANRLLSRAARSPWKL